MMKHFALIALLLGFVYSQKAFEVALSRKQNYQPKKEHKLSQAKLSQLQHILGDQAVVKPLNMNFFGFSYTSDVNLGSNYQNAEVVYDTGSGWLTVASIDCVNCKAHTYNYKKSTESQQISTGIQNLTYGSAFLQGYYYSDRVCLTNDKTACVVDFNFFAIEYQEGLDQYDGILGLSPDDPKNGPSFVSGMKDQGIIDYKILAFYLSFQQYQSNVMFGAYNSSMIKQGDQEGLGIHWFPLTGTYHWQIEIQDVIVEGDSVFTGNVEAAILDTGTSLMIFPVQEYTSTIQAFQNKFSGFTCEQVQPGQILCYFQTSCSNVYPQLQHFQFQFGDRWVFSVPPEDYMVEITDDNGNIFCTLGIGAGNFNVFILGDSFLRAYYTIYDFENGQAGIAVHTNSNAYLYKKFPTLIVVLSILGGLVVLGLITFCGISYYRKKQIQKNLIKYNQLQQSDSNRQLLDNDYNAEVKDKRNWFLLNQNRQQYQDKENNSDEIRETRV